MSGWFSYSMFIMFSNVVGCRGEDFTVLHICVLITQNLTNSAK